MTLPYNSREKRLLRESNDLLRSVNDSLDLLETKGVITKEEKDNVKPSKDVENIPPSKAAIASPVSFTSSASSSEEPEKKKSLIRRILHI